MGAAPLNATQDDKAGQMPSSSLLMVTLAPGWLEESAQARSLLVGKC